MFDDRERIEIIGDGPRSAGLAKILDQRGHDVSGPVGGEEVEGVGVVVDAAESDAPNERRRRLHSGDAEVIGLSEALQWLVEPFRTIAVVGTHGTGTVSSMIAWILECAGRRPGFLLSAEAHNFGASGRDGAGRWFVVELDERMATDHRFRCDYLVSSFLELSLPSYYKEIGDIARALRRFVESNRRLKEMFANLDCAGNRKLIEEVALRPTGYSINYRTEFRGHYEENGTPIDFRADHRENDLGEFRLQIPGGYNVVNALGAIAVAKRLGIETEVIERALDSYEGLSNRFAVARGGGVRLIKERASHPTALARMVDSAARGVEGAYCGAVQLPKAPMDASFRVQLLEAFEPCDAVTVFVDDEGDQGEAAIQSLVDERPEIEIETDAQRLVDELAEMATEGDTLLFVGDDRFLRNADHVQAQLATEAEKGPPKGSQPRLDGPLAEGDE